MGLRTRMIVFLVALVLSALLVGAGVIASWVGTVLGAGVYVIFVLPMLSR
jgi:hypothetical protein